MKNLLFIISIYAAALAQNDPIIKVEFQSLSRGYFEKVTITQDSLTIRKSENRGSAERVIPRSLSKKEWKSLLKDLSLVNLSEMPTLKSPTVKRTYDGARHSSIVIYTANNQYEHLFDDENPHLELQALMNCIIHIRDRK